jgi:DDE superfamily endonuclease
MVKQILDDAGIQYAYLPPYSPDLNPIEEGFAELKAWMRKYKKLMDTVDTLGEFANLALESLENHADGHFVRSRAGLPIQQGTDEDYWDQ